MMATNVKKVLIEMYAEKDDFGSVRHGAGAQVKAGLILAGHMQIMSGQ